MTRKELATAGEEAAAGFLATRGIRIVARNYRCPRGEIDLIGMDQSVLVFVEVKTRTRGIPEEAVAARKQLKLRQVATWYLAEKRMGEPACRFDVVSVIGSTPQEFTLLHLRDAF